jgi:hypothetical protein
MAVAVHGLDALEGETAFAFLVVRLRTAVDRAGLVAVLRYLAPLVPDADAFVAELPPELDEPMKIVGMPWTPPEAGHHVSAQRRLIEGAGAVGIEAAWFFQTGTSLIADDEDNAADDEADDDGDDDGPRRAMTMDDSWAGDSTSTTTVALAIDDALDERLAPVAGELGGDDDRDGDEENDDDDHDHVDDDERAAQRDDEHAGDDEDDDADEVAWSNGPPPQRAHVRFPVDGYPEIVEDLDWEDFGIAFKLAGPYTPGEGTVLLGFHTLWLAPYGGRYRNAAVTLDRKRHAAHLWVDRFAVPCAPEDQVQHLLWIVSRIDEVIPVVHARFGGASMAQKYGGLLGDAGEREPFVLGGNPLLAVHRDGGEAAVDAWIASQTDWSNEEIAAMLRELAIQLVSEAVSPPDDDDDGGDDDAVDALFDDDDPSTSMDNPRLEAIAEDEDDEDDEGDDDGGDEDDDEDDDEGEAEGNEDEDRGRQIAIYAGDLLRERAAAGLLDPRAAERLLPVLDQPEKFEHRRRAVVEILGALRYRPAVPALIRILDETAIKSSLDAIGKESFVAATAAALGAIGDPAAIPALSRVVAAPGPHNDKPRPVAAEALATCLAAAGEPRTVDDAVLAELLATVRERNDGELNAGSHVAYGRIARQLPPERRADARRKLLDAGSARDDATAMLARQAALVLASPTGEIDVPPRDLAPLLHEGLTSLDYDHDYTVRNLRVALRVAELVPDLVDPADLVWLTRFTEPDIRARAHALLARKGQPLAPARAFDARAARAVDDLELVHLIGEPHVIGRAALIAEAGRRGLDAAHRAIIDACHDVISRARQGGANLLDPDTRILETAVPILREGELDGDVIALFDRMLRHSNFHVKWELLQAPPHDARLIGGMFHVLGEHWGWQEKTAKEWLAHFQGTAAYEAERRRVGAPAPDDAGDDEPQPADEDIN